MTQSIADMLNSRKRQSRAQASALVETQRYLAQKQEAKVQCAKLKRELLNKRMQEIARESFLDFSSLLPDQYGSICKICRKALVKFKSINLGITPDDLCHDVVLLLLTQSHNPAKTINSLIYRLINNSLEQYISKSTIRKFTWEEGRDVRTYTPKEVAIEHTGLVEPPFTTPSLPLVDRLWS